MSDERKAQVGQLIDELKTSVAEIAARVGLDAEKPADVHALAHALMGYACMLVLGAQLDRCAFFESATEWLGLPMLFVRRTKPGSGAPATPAALVDPSQPTFISIEPGRAAQRDRLFELLMDGLESITRTAELTDDPADTEVVSLSLVALACSRAVRAGLDARAFASSLVGTAYSVLGKVTHPRAPADSPPPGLDLDQVGGLGWFEAAVRAFVDRASSEAHAETSQPKARFHASVLLMMIALDYARKNGLERHRAMYLKLVFEHLAREFGRGLCREALADELASKPPPPPKRKPWMN